MRIVVVGSWFVVWAECCLDSTVVCSLLFVLVCAVWCGVVWVGCGGGLLWAVWSNNYCVCVVCIKKISVSTCWSRSNDLWVMSPTRFLCAKVLRHLPSPLPHNNKTTQANTPVWGVGATPNNATLDSAHTLTTHQQATPARQQTPRASHPIIHFPATHEHVAIHLFATPDV